MHVNQDGTVPINNFYEYSIKIKYLMISAITAHISLKYPQIILRQSISYMTELNTYQIHHFTEPMITFIFSVWYNWIIVASNNYHCFYFKSSQMHWALRGKKKKPNFWNALTRIHFISFRKQESYVKSGIFHSHFIIICMFFSFHFSLSKDLKIILALSLRTMILKI